MAPLTRGLELLGWAISYALASTRLATPQRLPGPTPCADWDLGLLLRHVSDSVGVLHEAITTHDVKAVIHFAGLIEVGRSTDRKSVV